MGVKHFVPLIQRQRGKEKPLKALGRTQKTLNVDCESIKAPRFLARRARCESLGQQSPACSRRALCWFSHPCWKTWDPTMETERSRAGQHCGEQTLREHTATRAQGDNTATHVAAGQRSHMLEIPPCQGSAHPGRAKGQPRRAQQSYRHCWPELEGMELGATLPQTPPTHISPSSCSTRSGAAASDLHSWLLQQAVQCHRSDGLQRMAMGRRGLSWHRWGEEPSSFPPLPPQSCSLPQPHLQTPPGGRAVPRRARPQLTSLGSILPLSRVGGNPLGCALDIGTTCSAPLCCSETRPGSPTWQHTEPTASKQTLTGIP